MYSMNNCIQRFYIILIVVLIPLLFQLLNPSHASAIENGFEDKEDICFKGNFPFGPYDFTIFDVQFHFMVGPIPLMLGEEQCNRLIIYKTYSADVYMYTMSKLYHCRDHLIVDNCITLIILHLAYYAPPISMETMFGKTRTLQHCTHIFTQIKLN